MILRHYQVQALNAARASMQQGHQRPILMAPTGSGKTAISIELIKLALQKGSHVVFTVDRIQLIDQTAAAFISAGLDFGVIQGDHDRVKPWEPLQLASVQTLTQKRRRSNLPECNLLINDECHVSYKGLTEVMDQQWSDVKVLGLSATPFSKGLGKIYDDLIIVETTKSLIEQGYLSDYIPYGPSSPDLKGIQTQGGDYNQKQLGQRVNNTKIIGDIVKTWLALGDNRQTLCFAVNVAHSEAIVKAFLAAGVSAAHFDAHTPLMERIAILQRYESGQTKILSNCGITTKGFDSPNTDCLILGRPTKSLMLHIQMLGRVLRVGEAKADAIILDHSGNLARLGFPTDPLPMTLCSGTKSEAKADNAKKEKLPTACVKCTFLSAEFVCPSCGHVPEKSTKVEVKKGKLKRLKTTSKAVKAMWWGMLQGHAINRKFKEGWAAHKYKDKFGEWPDRRNYVPPYTPNEEVRKYIISTNIRHAKRNTQTTLGH